MIIKILYIAIGGALGSILRFFISNFCKIYFPFFLAGTLFVNTLGSFTTFSAFSIETLELLKKDGIYVSLIYIMSSIILSIFAAYIGFTLIKL